MNYFFQIFLNEFYIIKKHPQNVLEFDFFCNRSIKYDFYIQYFLMKLIIMLKMVKI